jgi:hypothetical protein
VVAISVPDTVLPVTSLLALRFPFWLAGWWLCVIHRLDHILKNKIEEKKSYTVVHFSSVLFPSPSHFLLSLFFLFFLYIFSPPTFRWDGWR